MITVDVSTTAFTKDKWGSGLQFLMSCIAMSIGLGNIWRFPFVVYQNGGGAFLIPYGIILILVGRPLYYLEMSLGQFTSKGNVKTFEALAAIFKGVGYCQTLGAIYIATYYCSLLALTLFYFINSFTGDLPWSKCIPEWEEQNKQHNITCIPSKYSKPIANNSVSSSELYFRREVLKEKTSIIDGLGYPDWRLTLCLAFAWFVSFIIIRSGIKSAGKASYFLALFPYVIMIALLIRAVTLDGAVDGMFYFVNPTWSKVADPQVWYAAATQCFFSLNVGFGNIISYASYNKFSHNIYRDSIFISVLDTFTSLMAGTTIFGILGNLAFKLNLNVSDVINSGGTGLAFISYPEAIARFDAVPWLFSIMFFLMLFIIGMGSLVSMEGNVYTVVTETFPYLKGWKVSLSIATIGFFTSLVYITPGGQFILNLVDYYCVSTTCFIANIVVVCLVSWFYGLGNFLEDVEFMLKRKHGIYWRLCWGIITPLVLVTILLYYFISMTELQHEGKGYPAVALAFGWIFAIFAIGQIPFWIVVFYLKNRTVGVKKMVNEILEHRDWRPANRMDYNEWNAIKMKKRSIKEQERSILKKIYYIFTGRHWKQDV